MKNSTFEKIFVTVGTTQFEELIEKVTESGVVNELRRMGCRKLSLQIGRGKDPVIAKEVFGSDIDVKFFDLKTNIEEDIQQADLVISHAGAGSCIEILGAEKPLVVVVNERLMDNHQAELAEQLFKEGYLLYCTPSTLSQTLAESDFNQLKKFPPGSVADFISYLDAFMGF
ncbi:UDP-N-acetylglucosamine transferase subunit ALG13 homolog [Malaya genurostris]|uniref:UDP-N-acetylglucosamine transferase subunit ALG13 homolog n=1 Tax=Malaya genurostris TaxID=325434 RepID=UPI0026F386C0|nr:UDP-N-acetylglucosamine transferase subunit ALG13 homolog [Malaya genurostris]XP_058464561.1 UDP-N-acetylglucosamine transferase subunit ALG13 homolog [Malaya genurostris]